MIIKIGNLYHSSVDSPTAKYTIATYKVGYSIWKGISPTLLDQ